ncbi:MAG: hypothetical protein COU90_01825 [Candidatus Ryanbacteria bacterium CG10_big_fil_rev_8_21_14_0_10_43_42]|uniref:SGNH hydrolase-type esterase domain-containing protein n=1 Tax=Candidatus Ryanbacteria bacterium CG10_big_fil_rev_8_21_14_0_10_43_42 TaxID=1974864 RepID=A0A2M8KX99_9BACT|nr:MAG: hypothetical protein COU90_01825 [Candidatus Ryanbacteria bacterium CG10_big_fil_rev_8_21_14_0_10_43_42]
MKGSIIFGISIIFLFTGIKGVQFYKRFRISKDLVQSAKPFSYTNPLSFKKILIVGDSTAVGVGVSAPEQSIAGRIHKDYPEISIENMAVSGQRLSDTYAILKTVTASYDLILIQSGANDILFFTGREDTFRKARLMVMEAKKHTQTVVWLTSGNIGLAPLFPRPIGWLYEMRSRNFLREFQIIADDTDVLFVDVYTTKEHDVFGRDVERYYAADTLHLSGEGYAVWYNSIIETLRESNTLHVLGE